MKLLTLPTFAALSLFAIVAAADAPARKPPVPPPAPTDTSATCKPTGVVSFEIDHTVNKPQASTLKIYANGAWTLTSTDKNGAAGPSGGACLDAKTSAQVNDLVKSAPWTSTSVIHCMARTAESTLYLSNGKPLFTEMMCNANRLDDKSAKALEDLKAIAAKLQPAPVPGAKP